MNRIWQNFICFVVVISSVIIGAERRSAEVGLHFNEIVPEFSVEKLELLRQHYCSIYAKVKEPEKFYIREIREVPEGYLVVLYPLIALQAASNSKKTEFNFVTGYSISVLFSKQWNFIRIRE